MRTSDKNKPIRPTIQAIAEKAGVSRATVSLILAGRKDVVSRFKPATVARVRETARAMGYHTNLMAVSLRSPHPFFFGMVLRGAGTADTVSWHHQAFEGQFLAGALEAARALKLYPVLATQDSPDPEGAVGCVQDLLDGGVFGAVLRTPVPALDEPIRRRIEQGTPVVMVFPEHPATHSENTIDMDNLAAGRLAGELLQRAGRSRWVIVREERGWEAIRLREEGAVQIGRESGARLDVLPVPAGLGERETMAWLMPRLKDLQPDGVYAASAVAGVGTLLACQRADLQVPTRTCLVGCDASLWRAPGCPSITSVDVSWYDAGDLAVRKMAELGDAGESTFASILLPPRVRRGDSCPGGDQDPPTVMPA
jgi:DNA-binding LacI/PurR family transcriptional regulator